MEIILGLSLGIVSLVAVLVTNRWRTFVIVAVCSAVAFVGLWIGTNLPGCDDTGTEIALTMCQQSKSVWDLVRTMFFGLPALVVLVVASFKLRQLERWLA
jgi:RsiW-degrading membrane proteinase PrsW (M82 family)